MASFAYKGVSSDGRVVTGTIEAESPRAARSHLRERGIYASDVHRQDIPSGARGPWRGGRSTSARDIARVMRQLATLVAAGVPLVDALASLAARPLPARLRAAIESIRNRIVAGESFHQAAAKHPDVLAPLYVGMIRAGESSGALDRVLLRIADHAEATARLQNQLRAALTYPVLMMIIGSAIVAFLLAYVVPQVTRVFLESNQTLPLPTRLLMALGRWVADYGMLALGVLAVGALTARAWAATARGRRSLEALAFRIPWLGDVMRNIAMARFAHTLSTMLSGGMPLVEALDAARGATGSALIDDALADSRRAVSEGETLASRLASTGLFHPMVVDMIAVGERSGSLEQMLTHAADALDDEARTHVEMMASVLEPAMIILMAGVVLFVVLAVLLPVFEMNQLVR